jgi:hypothetical protein
MGWNTLAQHLLSACLSKTAPRKQLTRLSWSYWAGLVTDATADRAPIAKRLRELTRQDAELDTLPNRELLRSLELALVPAKAKPGSIEAMIDELVDYADDAGTIGLHEPGDRYWRIAGLGFDAVPALIEHLDDDRLTRSIMWGFNNFPSWNLRVGDVVSDLLEGLAEEGSGRDWLRRQQGYRVDKAAALKWWDKARQVGERSYLLKHVLPSAPNRAAGGQCSQLNEHMLAAIAKKYPEHLPALYRAILDDHELDSHRIVAALLHSDLSAKQKVELLSTTSQQEATKNRSSGCRGTRDRANSWNGNRPRIGPKSGGVGRDS